ncbi:cytochrome P450 [Rhizopogon vinicolor AM-OR11-026]|uniref:Cytochrome P450 n=1 Tax=Rhizopogon vinicolor AM-OR11-026 TaxID=1314800 RepID=A0A1B7MIW6_9AGAM|nr:cytochrome P450 [Rhizopogon vinicolor AM-OR11-026]
MSTSSLVLRPGKSSSNDSPITFHRVFGRKFIVLNTLKAANDLLESRSNIYSDRPMACMYKELVNRGMAVFNVSSQHPRFKVYRRLLNTSLNARAVGRYDGILYDERLILLRGLATEPEAFIRHLRRVSGGVILKVAYGWTVNDIDDYFVDLMEQSFALSVEIMKPGRWLVDVFPILRFIPSWFPGAGFKRDAVVWREQMSELDRKPHAWAKEQIESGNYIDSFSSQHLRPEDGHEIDAEEEDIIKWCSAALYTGGADTTVSALSSFMLFMALHPDIQRRAQAEIDEVVGKNRLPTSADQVCLPYVSAVLKEVLRVAPVARLGLPHRVLREDEYLGYRIPRGSTVIANIWGITHDASLYPEPMTFNPDRFLATSDGPAQLDSSKIVFGYGRRICPGAHLAEVSMFLNIVGILATFNISKALDERGQEVEPLVGYTDGITSHPKPFKCCILPRSRENLAMLDLP